MLVYQRVYPINIPLNHYKSHYTTIKSSFLNPIFAGEVPKTLNLLDFGVLLSNLDAGKSHFFTCLEIGLEIVKSWAKSHHSP